MSPHRAAPLLPELLPPPPIGPVHAGGPRPQWSVMIPTFNCAGYLRQTLASVLAQDPGTDAMEIEVVDDCSTKDDPEAVVAEIGGGRVRFHRKAANGGATANFNTCIERSRGHLVHILHGDDVVLPGYYDRLGAAAAAHPEIAFLGCRSFFVNEQGVILTVTPRVSSLESPARDASAFYFTTPIQTAGAVVRRSFYEAHGGFLPTLVHTADWEMWARAVTLGGGLVLPDVLCHYRVFAGNDTAKLKRTAENLRDTKRLHRIMESRHPDRSAKRASQVLADFTRIQMEDLARRGDHEAYANTLAFYRANTPLIDRAQWALRSSLRSMWHRLRS